MKTRPKRSHYGTTSEYLLAVANSGCTPEYFNKVMTRARKPKVPSIKGVKNAPIKPGSIVYNLYMDDISPAPKTPTTHLMMKKGSARAFVRMPSIISVNLDCLLVEMKHDKQVIKLIAA